MEEARRRQGSELQAAADPPSSLASNAVREFAEAPPPRAAFFKAEPSQGDTSLATRLNVRVRLVNEEAGSRYREQRRLRTAGVRTRRPAEGREPCINSQPRSGMAETPCPLPMHPVIEE